MSLSHVPIKMETLFRWMCYAHSRLLNVYDDMCIRVWPGRDDHIHGGNWDRPYMEYEIPLSQLISVNDMLDYYEEDQRHRAGERPRWYIRTENRVHPV